MRLPVYYHWRFATGADGDVESLAAALHAVVAPPELGSVTVQLATADAELAALDPEAPGSVVVVRGALVAPPNDPPEPTVAQDARVDAVLRARVDDARAEGSVGPPLYGEWHRDVHRVPPDGWLAEANAIAERRIAAGLGATVVRANQEALVQACWDQVGALRDANQLFNRALVSSHVASRLIARHLAGLPMGRAAQVTSSWQARVLPPDAGAERVTVAGTIEASSLPEALLSAGYRRVAASRRPAARRAARAGLTRQRSAVDFAAADLLGLEPAGPPPDALEDFTPMTAIPIGGAEGAVPLRGLGLPGSASAGQLRALQSAAGSARVAPSRLNEAVAQGELEVIDELAPRGPGLDPDAGAALRLAEAWTATRDRLEAPAAPTAFVAAELSTLHGKVMAQADPATSIPRRTMGRLAVGDEDPDAPPFTGLRPIGDGNVPSTVVANPWVLTPVSGLLDRLPGSWLLPGMDGVPQDGVTVVETNPAFVAACLLGANQELEAELLWREFPTDRRGSPLRHFWARRDGAADIGPIHDWPGDASLGDLVSTTDGQLVLVVRGRLLLRYPDIVVYAIPGDPSGPSNDPSMAVLPDFFGRMDPDLTYAGFPMTKPQALADDVWFVLQQQPAAPRFGFDVFRDPNDPLETWSDVAWSDVGVAPGGHLDPEAQAVAGLDLPSGGIGTSVATLTSLRPDGRRDRRGHIATADTCRHPRCPAAAGGLRGCRADTGGIDCRPGHGTGRAPTGASRDPVSAGRPRAAHPHLPRPGPSRHTPSRAVGGGDRRRPCLLAQPLGGRGGGGVGRPDPRHPTATCPLDRGSERPDQPRRARRSRRADLRRARNCRELDGHDRPRRRPPRSVARRRVSGRRRGRPRPQQRRVQRTRRGLSRRRCSRSDR